MFQIVLRSAVVLVAVSVSSAAGRERLSAQGVGPGLVVPVPRTDLVRVEPDSFTASNGTRRQYDVYRPAAREGALPVVVFANGASPALRGWRSYIEWARLVTRKGMAAVLYDGPTWDTLKTPQENLRGSIADLDSVLVTLGRRGPALGIDRSNTILWAGSAQTSTATPVALEGTRAGIRGYVLYYGAGSAAEPRLDVPVLMVRAGLDAPPLNRALDSLSRQLTDAGVAVTVVSYPAGRHGFDILDSTAMTARVIEQTLDFMASAADQSLQRSVTAAVPEVRASGAFSTGRWAEAEQRYSALAREQPQNRTIAWRLGLAQLENANPAAALASFNRARELGQGGARDIGIPAVRAAIRAGDTRAAVEWTQWALRSFPLIRNQFAADRELSPMLEHPEVRTGASRGSSPP